MGENNVNRNGFQLVSKYRGAIMGAAALWILAFHAWVILSPEPQAGSFSLAYFLEKFVKETGYGGVDIFFFLSGIGMVFAIKKEAVLKFYYRRIRRVLLPALAIGIIRGAVQNWGAGETFRIIIGYNFFMKDIYNFLWFVHVIIIFYICFPLYWKLFEKAGNKVMFTGAVVLVWLLVTLLVRDTLRPDMFGFTNRIPVFVIGILFGYLTQKHKDAEFSAQTWVTLGIMLIVGLYLDYLTNFKEFELIVPRGNSFLPTLLIAVSATFLIAKLMDILERKLSWFGKGVKIVLTFFGSISLELYCIQWWFADMVPDLLAAGWNKHLVNISMLLIITATAWVMSVLFKYLWELVELPFKKKKGEA